MTTVTTAQANKLHQVALFTAATRARSLVNVLTEQDEAPRQISPEKKGPMQTNAGAPVVRVTDLVKNAGDEVDMQIIFQLSKRPTMGDRMLDGRGESLRFSDFKVGINQGRHMVDSGGSMTQKRTRHNLLKSARVMLGSYFNTLQDQCAIVHLAGARGDFTASDIILPTAEHPEFNDIMINDVTPPTYDRHFFAGDATSVETLDAADIFTLGVVDNLALYLEEMAHPLMPVRLSKDELKGTDAWYVLYITPRQWNDWYTSTSGKDWQQMMTRAIARSKGFDHPLFRGECAMWRNILVRKYGGMPVRFNTGSSVQVCQNHPDATVKTVQTRTTVDRALLLGGQALVNAYGVSNGGHFNVIEEKTDMKNRTQIAIQWINGLKKIRFRQKDGRINDHGIMVVDSAIGNAR